MREDAFVTVTAGILIIGNEILSGRTKEQNIEFLAAELSAVGVQLREVRIVGDFSEQIIEAVNQIRNRYDYVFTTGGIGPTHDDITSEAIAEAFGVNIEIHSDALAILIEHYKQNGLPFNDARKRMARIPEGGYLIQNPISKAPGFRIGNVFVLAGVPMICKAMFTSLKHELVGGDPVQSVSVTVLLSEGQIAEELSLLQNKYSSVDIGSYPFYKNGKIGTSIVCRSQDKVLLNELDIEIRRLIKQYDSGLN